MKTNTPLADRLRPATIDEVVGQQHLLAKDKVFRRVVESGQVPNMVFYGPSGCGKTTVSRIISQNSGMKLHHLNGTTASTGDIRDVVAGIGTFGSQNGILLYLDEIQYLNKKQQQSLLEFIEDGSITLIASTTENPYFYVYNALLSRCTVFEFKPLQSADILEGLNNALAKIAQQDGLTIQPEEGALEKLAAGSGGDMRKALNGLQFATGAAAVVEGVKRLTFEDVAQVVQRSSMRYDRDGDEHYDIISAYQKSMRGSDPDAALHYLARLLEADDLPSACRRLIVTAAEDVGLAWPQILPIVKAAVDMALQIGLPEAVIPLSDAVVLVCLAPKSDSAMKGGFAALNDVRQGLGGPIPRTLQNKHFDGADAEVKGQHYQNPHGHPDDWVAQQYLPDALKSKQYYQPGENKTETAFKDYWDKVKKRK